MLSTPTDGRLKRVRITWSMPVRILSLPLIDCGRCSWLIPIIERGICTAQRFGEITRDGALDSRFAGIFAGSM
jgi:hypothetical protein